MGDPKPLASLSSSLLARKGHARPAMRPQGFGSGFGGGFGGQDDLGWNDMGHDVRPAGVSLHAAASPKSAFVPVPEVVRQREELAEELNGFHAAIEPEAKLNGDHHDAVEATFEPIAVEAEAEAQEHVPPIDEVEIDEVEVEVDEVEVEEAVVEQDVLPEIEPEIEEIEQQLDHVAVEPVVALELEPIEPDPVQPEASDIEQPVALVEVEAPAPLVMAVKPIRSVAVARAKAAVKTRTGKAAFTLRLESERHLRLRLACAVTRESAQSIVTAALDAYLANFPEIDELARMAPGKTH